MTDIFVLLTDQDDVGKLKELPEFIKPQEYSAMDQVNLKNEEVGKIVLRTDVSIRFLSVKEVEEGLIDPMEPR